MAKSGDFAGVQARNGVLIKHVEELLINIQKWFEKSETSLKKTSIK